MFLRKYYENGRIASGIEGAGKLIHSLYLLDKDNPNGLSAGLSAEDVGQLKNGNIEVVIGIGESDVLLVDTASDIGVLLAELHIRALFGKVGEIRAEDNGLLVTVRAVG